jgi:hypothetical protein
MLYEFNEAEVNLLINVIRIAKNVGQPTPEGDEQMMHACLHFMNKLKKPIDKDKPLDKPEENKKNKKASQTKKTGM